MSHASSRRTCSEFRRMLPLGRRDFLKAGIVGSAGLSLAHLLRGEANAAAGSKDKRANNVIILWMRGGPPQHDLWDPKPEAPVEIRGEYQAAATAVPGIFITHMLPLSGQIMKKWSIVRSLHHDNSGHSAADQILFTGHPPGPDPDSNAHPSCGSVVARQLGQLDSQMPAYVVIPRNVPGTDSAYLGPACRPLETLADPASNGPFRMANLKLNDALTLDRLGGRLDLARDFDRIRRTLENSPDAAAVDGFQRQAWEMLTSSRAQKAFDLDAEPASLRERYGFMPEFKAPTPNRCGVPAWSQRLLLARRLVEAGVRLVTVDLRWWDTHVANYDSLTNGFLPRFDRAYSALIDDLHERGLLETTMVIAWGEFGRTPRINRDAGRDHYPNVFSAALAGGPIQGGRVLGSSDAHGAFPKERPVTPQDVLATMYGHLGVDTDAQYVDSAGRPITVLPTGRPLEDLS